MMLTVNAALFSAIAITLMVWTVQEWFGRRLRIAHMCTYAQKALTQGSEAGFPIWLRLLSGILLVSWVMLFVVLYFKRDGDFAIILVSLVLFCGLITLADRFLFRQRRVEMMGMTAVQQALSKVKSESDKQALTDWAETDYVAAEYAKSFFPVLLVVLLLRSFLLEPFKIPSASMVPTLEVHDFILVNKFAYGLRLPVIGTKLMSVSDPQRGDVMVFFPPNDNRYFIKRVIGLPGDEIRLVNNVLYINGVMMEQEQLRVDNNSWPPVKVVSENLQPQKHLMQYFSEPTIHSPHSQYQATVPAGQYFMMGDNRDNSSDSRFWGMVPAANVVGKAVYIWLHWGSWLSLPSFSRNGVIE